MIYVWRWGLIKEDNSENHYLNDECDRHQNGKFFVPCFVSK